MNKKITVLVLFLFLLGATITIVSRGQEQPKTAGQFIEEIIVAPTPSPALPPLPSQKILPSDYHVFQRFNNCGPASLSMALSHYGISVSQEEIGQDLRPYQVASGDNDDKSVTLAELAEKSKEYNLIPYHRPGGNEELVKQFIAHNMPVITRTLTQPSEDIGHYRVIKGYDEATREFIQDDSLQGKNLRYTYGDFNALWKQFNYEYLVLVPKDKQDVAERILGEDADPKVAWQRIADQASGLNLSVALFYLGDYRGSVQAFEQVEHQLSFRTLWYQIEPIQAYAALGDNERVLSLTRQILDNHNRAFSELYIIRGDIFKKQGDLEAARSEYQKAVLYNINLQSAHDALASVQ